MKKRLLVVLVIIIILAIVIGVICFNKNKGNNSSRDNSNTNTPVQEEYTGGVREVKNDETNFDDELGFSIEKGNEVKDVKYDTIFLHGDDKVQLDLVLDDNGKIGTLVVSKMEHPAEDIVELLLISETSVSKLTGLDGIDSYMWEKDGFYYRFSTKNDSGVTNDDIAKIINGYNVKVAEENIGE